VSPAGPPTQCLALTTVGGLERAGAGNPADRVGGIHLVSGSTIWRWPHDDAIRPWFHRSWIFLRDPEFATKAGRRLSRGDVRAIRRGTRDARERVLGVGPDQFVGIEFGSIAREFVHVQATILRAKLAHRRTLVNGDLDPTPA
jgi:hypothetical protein